jgi:pyruvate/2-oxoglutarate dehydrogenase complex dihydrolipoamide dehydrogenase (E3) component
MKAVPRRLLVLGGGPVGVEMAQAVRRLGGEVVLVERADHVLDREPAPLGEALAEVLRADGIELLLGARVTGARRDKRDYVLQLDGAREVRGDRLLLAAGRRPRVDAVGLESVGVPADPHGVAVDARMRAGERLWAIGDVTGIWPLTHVDKYQGDIVAANILGEGPRGLLRGGAAGHLHRPVAGRGRRHRRALQRHRPRRRGGQDRHLHARVRGVRRLLTLLSDGERLTGAYALGPEAGEWLQQATLAIRARVPLDVLRDTIQPFTTFSEIYADALKALRSQTAAQGHAAGVGSR